MTENCIVCLRPAIYWTFHVLKGKNKITAGWCENHKYDSEDYTKTITAACFGNWKPEYGLKKRTDEI